jgi:hypothetical protein
MYKGKTMKTFILTALLATTSLAHANDIILSEKIKNSLKSKIERDMTVLDNLKLKDVTPRTLEVMGVSTLNASTASKWLNERVNYVIEEDALSLVKLLFKKTIYVEQKNVSFPNGNVLPYSQDPKNQLLETPITSELAELTNNENVLTVMSNMGAALYMGGKSSNTLYGMKVSRGLLKKQIRVTVDSPRAGIIQVGEGLFHKQLTVNPENENALANSLNRLATFFHEARHSDGNGASLAYAHSKCPAGHELAGEYACDENLNGPYTVGALMTVEMIKSCDDNCSEREKEILKLIALDSAGRVMQTTKKGTPAVDWDASPESL